MKKVSILLIGCLFLVGGVFAQDETNQQDRKAKRQQIIDQLELTDDQQTELKKIKEENRNRIKELKADSTLTEDERKIAFKELRTERKEQVNEVLTDEQIAKLKEIKQEHRKKNAKTPEERAQTITDKMVEKLELDTGQTEKVKALNFKVAKEISELKQNEDLTPEEKKESVKTVKGNHKSEMESILTEAQFSKYEKHLEERKQMKKEKASK